MRLFVWLLRALVFFTLFAFALNNQHGVTVHWFFGAQWHAPMVMIVLTAFGAGCALGMLALAPRRWRRSRSQVGPIGRQASALTSGVAASAASQNPAPEGTAPTRDGV